MTQKKALIFFWLLFGTCLKAQVQGDSLKMGNIKWTPEIGLELYTADMRPVFNGGGLYHELRHYWLSAAYFRMQKERKMFRCNIGYYQSHTTDVPGVQWGPATINTIEQLALLRCGYQYLFSNKRIAPVFSMDLGYAYAKSYAPTSDIMPFSSFLPPGGFQPRLTVTQVIGLGNSIGLRMVLNNWFCINIETGLRYFYYTQKNQDDPQPYPTIGFGYGLQPLQCSIGLIL